MAEFTQDFGTDIGLDDDIDDQASEVSGTLLVSQAIYRRLTTPRGTLIDDPDYGLDIRSLLHKGMTPVEIGAYPGQIRQEILKDERITFAEVIVKQSAKETWLITIRCEAGEGPFTLTLGVADAVATLLSTTGGGE